MTLAHQSDLAFDAADYFGLKDKEARAIAAELAAVVSDWRRVAETAVSPVQRWIEWRPPSSTTI